MTRVLYIMGDSLLLNPSLNTVAIEADLAEDPEGARSEWLAEWRADISGFLDDKDIDAAVVTGRNVLGFAPRTGYVAFLDPSGGRHDAFTLAIAHRNAEGKRVLDRLEIVNPPFEPEATTERYSEIIRSYGLRSATGDRYGAEWVSEAFRRYGVRYEPAELDRSSIYMELLPEFAGGRVELLDEPRLATELRLLERRPRSGGRGDSVDHPPRGSDDVANAACGALWLSAKAKARPEYGSRPAYAIT